MWTEAVTAHWNRYAELLCGGAEGKKKRIKRKLVAVPVETRNFHPRNTGQKRQHLCNYLDMGMHSNCVWKEGVLPLLTCGPHNIWTCTQFRGPHDILQRCSITQSYLWILAHRWSYVILTM